MRLHKGSPGYRLSYDNGREGGVPVKIYGLSTPWAMLGIVRTDHTKHREEKRERANERRAQRAQ